MGIPPVVLLVVVVVVVLLLVLLLVLLVIIPLKGFAVCVMVLSPSFAMIWWEVIA